MALTIPVAISIVIFYIFANAASVGSNIWLSEWSNDEVINGTQDIPLRNMRLGVYAALGFGQGKMSIHIKKDFFKAAV